MPPAVLYVDDEPDNIAVFAAMYERVFTIHTAISGEAALALLRTGTVEVGVILTDQRMPGMSGIDLAEMVHREFPDIVTLLITAFADLYAVIDAINRGEVHRYLKKPWEVGDIELALREALSVYDMRRRIADLERTLMDTSRVYALGVIAASLAHDLRDPVTALKTNLDDLSRNFSKTAWADGPSLIATEMRSSLSDAIESTRYLEDLLRAVSASTRPVTNDELVDLSEVSGTVLRMLRSTSSQRARIRFEALPAPFVRASRSKLGQVVLNLVINAMQAFPERPIHENLVRVSVRHLGDQVVLIVEDNGVGIDAAQLPKIFDPFYTTKGTMGTGLGLAIAREIVREIGGDIRHEHPPGGGTRFRVSLPAAA